VGGWMDGRESRVKYCLQQSKIEIQSFRLAIKVQGCEHFAEVVLTMKKEYYRKLVNLSLDEM
jgi:hypothetical protein